MNYKNIRFIGRHILKDGKEFFSYSGCGFEFAIKQSYYGSSITLSLDSETREFDFQYIAIFINGEFVRKEKLVKGNNKIKILLSDFVGKTVIKVIKLNETYLSSIYLDDIILNNTVIDNLEPANKELVGFFGDSITCGFGNLDFRGNEFKMETEDFMKTYGYLTASALNMDYSVIARGGISVAIRIYNDKLLGDIYDTVDMFEKCQPEQNLNFAVINIGTNDNSGYLQLIKDEDKPNALHTFKNKYLDLIARIIKDNPNVKLVMVYRMLPLDDAIVNAIKDVFKEANRTYKNTIRLLECVPNSDGGCCHPYWTGHEEASRLLIDLIRNL